MTGRRGTLRKSGGAQVRVRGREVREGRGRGPGEDFGALPWAKDWKILQGRRHTSGQLAGERVLTMLSHWGNAN